MYAVAMCCRIHINIMNKCDSTMKLVSLDPVQRDDWTFKVSVNNDNGIIMIHSHNALFQWSQIRFFDSEMMAKDYVEYLVMQSKNLKEKN